MVCVMMVVSRMQALGGGADGEGGAVEDALDVVAAHVEVGDGVEPPELDRRDVVRLRRLLLGAYTQRLSSWSDAYD